MPQHFDRTRPLPEGQTLRMTHNVEPLDVSIKESQPSPTLLLAGDYSEGGANQRVASFAVTVLPDGNEVRLRRALLKAIRNHIPSVNESNLPELHLTNIWSGQKRRGTPFAALESRRHVERLMLELANNIGRIIPFSAVACSSPFPAEAKKFRAPELLMSALHLTSNLLALSSRTLIGRAPLLLDRGDGVRLIVPSESAGLPGLIRRDIDGEGRPICDPVAKYVESHEHALVQTADFSAFVVVRLLDNLENLLTEAPKPQRVDEYNFFLRLARLLRLQVEVSLPLHDPEFSVSAWERHSTQGKAEEIHSQILRYGHNSPLVFPILQHEFLGVKLDGSKNTLSPWPTAIKI